MRSRRWLIGFVLALAALLLVGRIAAGWYVEYQWYAALGATDLWRARASDLLLLRGSLCLAGSTFVFLNLYAVRRSFGSFSLPRRIGNIEIGEEVPGRFLLIVVLALSVLLGALLSMRQNDWISLDLIRHGTLFGETDPYFQRDLAFWVYWLPLESSLHLWAFVVLLSVFLVCVFFYALTPSLHWHNGRLHVTGYVRRHLFALGAVLLLLLSWTYRLDAYGLLTSGSGALGTFSAIDHRVGLPVNLILSVVAVAGAMLVVWSGWTAQIRTAFFTITAVLLIALTLRQIVPPVAERFIAPADPEARERPYRATRDGYTRRAYDVDRLTREAPAPPAPSFVDAARGASLWDGIALARAIEPVRPSSRVNGALGWEVDDERLVAVAVEQPTGPESVDAQPPWHVTRIAADVADQRGGLVELTESGTLTASTLYGVLVSDSASTYAIVSDTTGRVAAPDLRAFSVRLAHAWRLQEPGLLRGSFAAGRNRIVLRRDLRARLHALYPFFEQGSEVSPIVWRDSLFWAVHLYATSEWYPLSAAMDLRGHLVHYLRHAAVALVNAHTGRSIAIGDPYPDPVTVTWMGRFPSLFVEPGALDRDLLRKLPPAVDGTIIEAAAFAQVGVRNEYVPPSHLPRETGADTVFTMRSAPPYVDHATGLLSIAIAVLDARDRLRGVVTGEGGPEAHLSWRPRESEEARWPQVVDRLQRAGDSLRSVLSDTRLLEGAVRIVPSAGSVLSIETHYATRPDGTPHVVYVSVLHGDSVSSGATIADAVGVPGPPVNTPPPTPEEFRARVEALYTAMHDALRRGDWTAFGTAYEALGRLLRTGR